MGCKGTVLPDPLLKNHSVKCLPRKPYIGILCLLKALALHLHGIERFDKETSNLFSLFLKKTGESDPASFRGACNESIAAVKDIVQVDFFLVRH